MTAIRQTELDLEAHIGCFPMSARLRVDYIVEGALPAHTPAGEAAPVSPPEHAEVEIERVLVWSEQDEQWISAHAWLDAIGGWSAVVNAVRDEEGLET